MFSQYSAELSVYDIMTYLSNRIILVSKILVRSLVRAQNICSSDESELYKVLLKIYHVKSFEDLVYLCLM